MYCREQKARCPKHFEKAFIEYLYQTGVKDTSETVGFKGAQILSRDVGDKVEITLNSYWETLECIKAFAGEEIGIAKLYPEDKKYELEPDHHVNHYKVVENQWQE